MFRFAVLAARVLSRAALTAAALAGEERWVASLGLLDVVDAYVPMPERYVDAPFLMAVENSLTSTGRGTVVTGAIERGLNPALP